MFRQRSLVYFISILFLTSLACNAFAGTPEPSLELPPPEVSTASSTPTAPGETAAGIAPTATLPGDTGGAGTPVGDGSPVVTVLVDLNIRTGPGVNYNRIGFFLEGAVVPVLGTDPVSGWWKVQCPSDVNAVECWVSGGEQYTRGSNTGGVPIAAVPPTPTPPPTNTPTPEPDLDADTDIIAGITGLVVYVDDAGLWVVSLDMSQSPPTGSDPVQIMSGSNITRVFISSDGQKVAYTASDFNANSLGVVNIDGTNNRTLVNSSAIPVDVEDGDTGFAALINEVQWLPNSQSIAFSSNLVFLEGPGFGPQADLWTVTLDGTLTERFSAGTGGHTFALSPNGNQVILGRPESVIRANLDGTNAETVITFDFINTASEYAYAPTGQWTADGSQAYMAIPGPDPWQDNPTATLYRIPSSGAAVTMDSVRGNILFDPVHWAPNGDLLAHVELISGPAPIITPLIVADASGGEQQVYTTGERLGLYGWSPGSTHFLYAGEGFYGIGQIGAAPVEVLVTVETADMQWLNNESFIAATGNTGSWNLISSNRLGDSAVLTLVNTDFIQFDVWSP